MNLKQLERLEKILLDAIEATSVKALRPESAKALAMLTLALLEVSREWRKLR